MAGGRVTSPLLVSLLLLVVWWSSLAPALAATYSDVAKVFHDKLGPASGYKTNIRPLLDQSKVLVVDVNFGIQAITELNDRMLTFVINGYFNFQWTDELLTWDVEQYNKTSHIFPDPLEIYRPRMVLLNTALKRDIIEDNYEPLVALNTGRVLWFPGGNIHTSCRLDLLKYPFDIQTCSLHITTMFGLQSEISYQGSGKVTLDNYAESGQWEILDTNIQSGNYDGRPDARIQFVLKRRHGYFLLNVVMPIVFLSLMNFVVFLIPVESGERISYGITMLLALTLFMSFVNGMFPSSSDVTPLINIYVVVLLILSVCSMLLCIFNVSLHHCAQREAKDPKHSPRNIWKFPTLKIEKIFQTRVNPLFDGKKIHPVSKDKLKPGKRNVQDPLEREEVDKGKELESLDPGWEQPASSASTTLHVRHLDHIAFVTFFSIWAMVTIVYFGAAASP